MKGNKKPRAHAGDGIQTKIVERKTRKQKKAKAKYKPQELFEKLAKSHKRIADSLRNKKHQSAKRLYHEELAETFAFLAKKDNGEDQESNELTRIPPMFKGALIMVMPDELKRLSRRINELERENEETRKY